ncbi:MAG: hypothetical protein M0R03_16525 [Novosphingobium sp.]|nr:hypothetical protein [Novosphingobium sp.]
MILQLDLSIELVGWLRIQRIKRRAFGRIGVANPPTSFEVDERQPSVLNTLVQRLERPIRSRPFLPIPTSLPQPHRHRHILGPTWTEAMATDHVEGVAKRAEVIGWKAEF